MKKAHYTNAMTSEVARLGSRAAEHVSAANAVRNSITYVCLALATIFSLLPFSNRAFDIDDTLFIWAGKHITQQPLNAYNFSVVWYWNQMPMWEVTKNPPLASYYLAVIGKIAGWSERALHLGFIAPAIAVVLGTYRLARHFTRNSVLAAMATLLTPGFLVSACSVMCDIMMLAFWVWAAVMWIEGLEHEKTTYLLAAGLLTGASELTKYFGAFLTALLFLYALASKRRWGTWFLYLLIPVLILGGYEYWTHALYGKGLFADAARFARVHRRDEHLARFSRGLIGLSFAGGCSLTALTYAPLLWPRKHIYIGGSVVAALAAVITTGLLKVSAPHAHAHWTGLSIQMAVYVIGGVSLLALAVVDWWNRRDRDSLFLAFWVFGTFCFAAFLNYTINARSILPLIPAAAILLARRMEGRMHKWRAPQLAAPLVLASVITFLVAWGDMAFANAQRRVAFSLQREAQAKTVWFEGHWGFQYYMQLVGARPMDTHSFVAHVSDLVVVPSFQPNIFVPANKYSLARIINEELPVPVATQDWNLGAGFYSSRWGPLPFAFGPVRYQFYVLEMRF